MGTVRKPLQGVHNIIVFNWHFYVISICFIFFILLISNFTNSTIETILQVVGFIIAINIVVSLTVSYYVYDFSGLYNFEWIKSVDDKISVININAGFDETSTIILNKFKNAEFQSLDFYDPEKHTEVSIKRARKKYPPYANTLEINTSKINLESNSIDKIFIILSAHEIRNKEERIRFFNELNRLLKPNGQIVVIEHLRDVSNFMAYTIGSFHFYSKSSWFNTFSQSKLKVVSEIKNTPFISTFTLKKDGNTL